MQPPALQRRVTVECRRWPLAAGSVGSGLLLRPKSPFQETTVNDAAGCLRHKGEAKTLDEMDQAIARGVREYQHGID